LPSGHKSKKGGEKRKLKTVKIQGQRLGRNQKKSFFGKTKYNAIMGRWGKNAKK